MSTNQTFTRSVALEKALKLYEDSPTVVSPDQVVAAAEKFRAFLSGDDAAPEPFRAEDKLPVFRLPRLWDGYVYFRFKDSSILYRSDRSYGFDAPGSVSRISPRYETEWRPARDSNVDTRAKLVGVDGYNEVSGSTAATVVAKNMTGVRFE